MWSNGRRDQDNPPLAEVSKSSSLGAKDLPALKQPQCNIPIHQPRAYKAASAPTRFCSEVTAKRIFLVSMSDNAPLCGKVTWTRSAMPERPGYAMRSTTFLLTISTSSLRSPEIVPSSSVCEALDGKQTTRRSSCRLAPHSTVDYSCPAIPHFNFFSVTLI
jgi:hypothetical protein